MVSANAGEVLPAMWLEGFRAGLGQQGGLWPARMRGQNLANFMDGNTGDFARQLCRGGCGEEELVVFSAVEDLIGCREGDEGQSSGVELGGDAGLSAEVGEVGGEAVAQVDGGGGHRIAREPKALSYAWRGKKMPVEKRLEARWNWRKRRRLLA